MKNNKADILADSVQPISLDSNLSLEQIDLLLRQEHDNETVLNLMRNFCMQSTSDDIRKKGMEFLYINDHINDLQVLVNKNNASGNESNRKWAEVYQMIVNRRRRQGHPPREQLKILERFQTEDPELRCVIEFLRIAIYFDLKEFGKFGNFLDQQAILFDAVEDPLLLSYFNLRLYQTIFIYYWTRNELIMARKYAFRLLNDTTNNKVIVNTHINLALTYTFDTYFQGMYHMNEAKKIAKKYHYENTIRNIDRHNIPFLAAHFKRPDGIVTDDPIEQAHLEIAKGNNKKAIAILSKQSIVSPFEFYYLGLAKRDKDILLKAYNQFIEKRSDYFFCRLPLNVLVDMD